MSTLLSHLPPDLLRQVLSYKGLETAPYELWMTLCKRLQATMTYFMSSAYCETIASSFPWNAYLTSFRLRKLTIYAPTRLVKSNFHAIAANGLRSLPATLLKLKLIWHKSADCLDVFASQNPYRPDDSLDFPVFQSGSVAATRVNLLQACPRLEKLIFSLGNIVRNFDASKFPTSLKYLKTELPYGKTWGGPILGSLPRWLSTLYLNTVIEASDEFLSQLPPSLTELILMSRAELNLKAAILPKTLTNISGGSFVLSPTLGASLPPSLTSIDLQVYNSFETEDLANLPRSLTGIILGNNEQPLVGKDLQALPPGLTYLNGAIELVETESSDFPASLRTLELLYDKSFSAALIKEKLPKTLRKFEIGYDIDFYECNEEAPEDIDEWVFNLD